MIGNKFYSLLKELTKSQRKVLLYRGEYSSDKRYRLFRQIILTDFETIEDFNEYVFQLIDQEWEIDDFEEKHLKARRLTSFFAKEIEDFLMVEYLKENNGIRNFLIAKSIEKNGNTDLISSYYNKSYKSSKQNRDYYFQLLSLKGNIRMAYASQNDKMLKQALDLNIDLIKLHKYVHLDRLVDYYYNISNIYIEKNQLINQDKEAIIKEVKNLLEQTNHPLNKGSLYISLAKLNYDDEDLLDEYLFNAKFALEKDTKRDKEYKDLFRKIRFLELRLKFFSGEKLNELILKVEDTVKNFSSYSIINNNTMFYKILFLIIEGKNEKAKEIIKSNSIYFRKEDDTILNFLKALIFFNEGDYKRTIKILQSLIYVKNYFFAIFSRLLLVKVQYTRNKLEMVEPILKSTSNLLSKNDNTPLGHEANLYVLNCYKSLLIGNEITPNSSGKLSVLHKYLLP